MKQILFLVSALAVSFAASINLDEECSDLTYAALPFPGDQNKFIGCILGKGQILTCQQEDEVFDSFLSQCVKTEKFSGENVCSNVMLGLFGIENDCTRFIICVFMQKSIRECPSNTIFDIEREQCVPGNQETCTREDNQLTTTTITTEDSRTSTTNPVPTTQAFSTTSASTTYEPLRTTEDDNTVTTTQEISTTEDYSTFDPATTRRPNEVEIKFVCPVSGWGKIPHPTDCSRFFKCIQGVRYPDTCPYGQVFDVITNECSDPETSFCAVNIRCGAS